MSKETAQLIAAFEKLPRAEKQVFAKEIFRRMPPFDSGALSDEEIAAAGDQLAALLDEEEHDAQAR